VYLLTPEQYQADTFGTTLQSQLKMSVGKFELYTRLMGGEDKLPPKLPEPHLSETTNNSEQPAANASEDKIDPNKILDAFGNLQTYDDFVTAHPISAPHMTAHDSKKSRKPSKSALLHVAGQVKLTLKSTSLWTLGEACHQSLA
jgi:hypothetical protein